jgi:hypothetical protein
VFDCRYVYYRATIPSGAAIQAGDGLVLSLPEHDHAIAMLNDRPLTRLASPEGSAVFQLDPARAREANSKLTILYENTGHANGNAVAQDRKKGISGARLVPADALARPIENWRMHAVDSPTNRPEIQPDFDDSGWAPAKVTDEGADVPSERTAVFRATFDAPVKSDNSIFLTIGRIDDDGWVYLNGKKVGETHDWSRAFRFDVTKLIRPEKNVIAIVVRNASGPGGLSQGVALEPQSGAGEPVALSEIATETTGSSDRWSRAVIDDSQWETLKLNGASEVEPASVRPAALRWYRAKFEIPQAKWGVWAPWKMRLDATGNGFVYLNGHALGRYWDGGPQREFYLPECWLNVGAGKENVVTLCLRMTDRAAPPQLKSAEVSVYAEQAELRLTE